LSELQAEFSAVRGHFDWPDGTRIFITAVLAFERQMRLLDE